MMLVEGEEIVTPSLDDSFGLSCAESYPRNEEKDVEIQNGSG